MKLQRRLLTHAVRELREFHSWLGARSETGAARWLDSFEKASELAVQNPLAMPLAPENSLVRYDVRQFVFKTARGRRYRAIFTVQENELLVLHIRGPGQEALSELVGFEG